MIPFSLGFLTCLSAFFRSRYNLSLEILALRQQLGVFKRKQPHPRLRIQDRIFWILREAFPEFCPYRYAILGGEAKSGEEVTDVLTTDGMTPVRASPASCWRNGLAERWIGSCRRELSIT